MKKLIYDIIRFPDWLYANLFGYFWLPCDICGNNFGGHEWLLGHTLYQSVHKGTGICYRKSCKQEADKRNAVVFANSGWSEEPGR